MNPIHTIDYIRILPELVLTAFGIVVMMADPLLKPGASRKGLGLISLAGTIAAIAAAFCQIAWSARDAQFAQPGWFGMVRVDSFALFFHLLIPAISAVCILLSLEYLDAQNIRSGEYYALILFGTVGMVLMSSAVELVLIFIALEISSISTYILAGYRRRNAGSSESALKYFLLGSFATAFFLYGVALIFGQTGSTSILTISKALATTEPGLLAIAATALMIVGLGFKVAAAPFHVWTPDVYEGAPAPIVALMSTGPKAAAFAVLLRVLFATQSAQWFVLIWICAALSMTLGNFGALMQNNVKRMLAYSSIAHAGYLLVAFAASNQIGISAAIFYTAAYAAMNVGAFAVVSHFAAGGERYISIDDYSGLGRRSPLLAFTLTIFMLSLIGIPATAGFLGKYYVFSAALSASAHPTALVWLTVIGLVNSAVASFYYLRLIVVMYMREPVVAGPPAPATFTTRLALVLAALATIYLGVMPGRVQDLSVAGAHDLTPATTAVGAVSATAPPSAPVPVTQVK
ncbi:MAG TPA: NADH-quinone oxidoreductase subunit N [Candidatus Angelobacter sp.]|jgi:NADH-quinone oxidoreductase subunit N|nr:NADH-quinone oxidoreductase subunit N [Candidatus Angelobacter sp.]